MAAASIADWIAKASAVESGYQALDAK